MMQSDTLRIIDADELTCTLELQKGELADQLAVAGSTSEPLTPASALPPTWRTCEVERWCDELGRALRRFGMHGLDTLSPEETATFQDRWGVPFPDCFGPKRVGRVLREYFGLHRRDDDGMSMADFAAVNAQHMGPFLGKFAGSVALSAWDIYAVEAADGTSARLRSLHTGEELMVHATVDDQRFEPRSYVIARIVTIQNLRVATTVVSCAPEVAIATLGELHQAFDRRGWRAFMRGDGARILVHEMVRVLLAEGASQRERFAQCTPRDVIALHAIHSAVELAVDEGRLTSSVAVVGDIVGHVAGHAPVHVGARDDGVVLVLERGEQCWEFRRVGVDAIGAHDRGWLESLGLRPALHGAVVCSAQVPDWSIAAAEMIFARLT